MKPSYQSTMKYLHLYVKRKCVRFKFMAWCSDAHHMEHPIEWDIVLIPWKQRGRLVFTLSALAGTH